MTDSEYQRTKRSNDKRIDAGLVLVGGLWTHPDDRDKARKLARALPKTKKILDDIKGNKDED